MCCNRGNVWKSEKERKISLLYFTIRTMSQGGEEDEKTFIGVDLA